MQTKNQSIFHGSIKYDNHFCRGKITHNTKVVNRVQQTNEIKGHWTDKKPIGKKWQPNQGIIHHNNINNDHENSKNIES